MNPSISNVATRLDTNTNVVSALCTRMTRLVNSCGSACVYALLGTCPNGTCRKIVPFGGIETFRSVTTARLVIKTRNTQKRANACICSHTSPTSWMHTLSIQETNVGTSENATAMTSNCLPPSLVEEIHQSSFTGGRKLEPSVREGTEASTVSQN